MSCFTEDTAVLILAVKVLRGVSNRMVGDSFALFNFYCHDHNLLLVQFYERELLINATCTMKQ